MEQRTRGLKPWRERDRWKFCSRIFEDDIFFFLLLQFERGVNLRRKIFKKRRKRKESKRCWIWKSTDTRLKSWWEKDRWKFCSRIFEDDLLFSSSPIWKRSERSKNLKNILKKKKKEGIEEMLNLKVNGHEVEIVMGKRSLEILF